jgi:hypothetical protein
MPRASFGSLSGVEVPCALTYWMSEAHARVGEAAPHRALETRVILALSRQWYASPVAA